MVKHSPSGMHHLLGACVLIVHDDQDTADEFGMWLRDAGHRVSIVSDAARALILAPLLRPAVVVVDLDLPVVDGLDVAGQLRTLPELASCSFVAIAAYSDASLAVRCGALGFADVLQTPVARPALVKSVYAAAGLHRRARLVENKRSDE